MSKHIVIIARCPNGHKLTEKQVASGRCPDCKVELFPGKGPTPIAESPPPGDWEGTDDGLD